MAIHYTLWVVVPSIVWGPLAGIGLYLAIWGLAGVCFALVFAPAHIGLPIVSEQHHDWLHQLETTRDLEHGLRLPGGSIFHGDLAWPWAEDDEPLDTPARRWGVDTGLPGVLLCGSGAALSTHTSSSGFSSKTVF